MTFPPVSNTITFEAALRDLGSKSAKVRAMAAHALGDLVEPAERQRAADALIAVLDDPEAQIRAEASMSLGDLELELAVAPLIDKLDDPTPLVRQAAAMALGRLRFRSGFSALAEALGSPHPDLRFQAATSLAEIDPDRALQPLLDALTDEGDGEVLSAIALALGAIGDRSAAPALAAVLEELRVTGHARFDVAYGLAELGGAAAAETLRRFLADPNLGWDAIEGLVKLGDPSAADDLAALLGRRKLAKPLLLRAAAGLFELSPHHEAADRARAVLIRGLSERKPELCGLAIDLLGRVGGSWAVEPLQAARRHRRGRRFAEEIDEVLIRLTSPTPAP